MRNHICSCIFFFFIFHRGKRKRRELSAIALDFRSNQLNEERRKAEITRIEYLFVMLRALLCVLQLFTHLIFMPFFCVAVAVAIIVCVDAIKKLYKRNNQTGKRGRQKTNESDHYALNEKKTCIHVDVLAVCICNPM